MFCCIILETLKEYCEPFKVSGLGYKDYEMIQQINELIHSYIRKDDYIIINKPYDGFCGCDGIILDKQWYKPKYLQFKVVNNVYKHSKTVTNNIKKLFAYNRYKCSCYGHQYRF